MIFDVINESVTPHLSVSDRMILALYDLGITTKPQLATITGWTDSRINETLKRIRARDKANKDAWIRSWQPKSKHPYVYALGEEGFKAAKLLRGENGNGNGRKIPAKPHVWHFLGLNQILVRLLEARMVEVEEWLSGKEAASWVYHALLERTHPGEKPIEQGTPLRPDAMVQIAGVMWAIEYDTGTEPTPRLEAKFHRYLSLAAMLPEGEMPPVLFVTVSDRRRNAAARAFDRAVAKYPSLRTIRGKWDHIQFLTEGEEVPFLERWLRG